MRKFLAAILLIICCNTCFAADGNRYAFDRVWRMREPLMNSIKKLAQNIADHNKPALEVKLSKSERYNEMDGWISVRWLRTWAKDKTIVQGWAGTDKKFYADCLDTADPNMIFAGGIHVGASIRVLEKYFNAPINQLAFRQGIIHTDPSSEFGDSLTIFYKDGKITEIFANWDDDSSHYSIKVRKFYNSSRQRLGFPNNNINVYE